MCCCHKRHPRQQQRNSASEPCMCRNIFSKLIRPSCPWPMPRTRTTSCGQWTTWTRVTWRLFDEFHMTHIFHKHPQTHVQSFSYSHTATPKRDSWIQAALQIKAAPAAKSERPRAFPKQTPCFHQVCTSPPALKRIALRQNPCSS